MKIGRPKSDNRKEATVTIRLSNELLDKIKQYASEQQVSKTTVILQSLEEFFSKR